VDGDGAIAMSGGGSALRLDSGLIDMTWAAQMQASGLLDFQKDPRARFDSAIPIARDLNYVLATVRDEYVPGIYASVLQSEPIPEWAERWEISKISGAGGVQLSSQVGRQDIITADFAATTTTGKVFEIVNGYKYWARELVRAAITGINPQTERALLQAQAAEEFLDSLVATGLVGGRYGAGGERDMGLGLTGLANDANVVALGLVAASAKTSTTTSWTTAVPADYGSILNDLHALVSTPYVRSRERWRADTLLMPMDEMIALNRLRPSNFAGNALETFMSEWQRLLGKPGRIITWERLRAIGSIAAGPRLVAFNASKTVAARITGKEYGVDQVREVTRGFEANASLVTGGVRILDASGIAYMDLAA
jgi:hypothetical protein